MNSKAIVKTIFLCIMGIVSSVALYAQSNVSGTVTDSAGDPISGVTVMIPGTTRGTSTNNAGSYTINVGNSEYLEYSCLGYKTKQVKLNGQALVDVELEEDSTLLDETIVVGYGVQKKVNLTGAVAVIESSEIENRSSSNLSNLLQGTMAGVNVTTTSGLLGSSANVNVRGYTSINGGSPLVLVDGAIGDLDLVNYNDVESVSVIKDASAAAVYGGRAAFGVILVTTKSAKEGSKPKVQLTARWGWDGNTTSTDYETTGYWSAYTANQFYYGRNGTNFIDYSEADMAQLLARVHDKTENPDRPWVIEEVRNGRNQWVYYCNTDWWHEMFKDKRPRQSYNINVSGSSKNVRYMISGGYEKENGLFAQIPDIYQKYNLRTKLDFDVNKWLTISNNTSIYSTSYDYPGYMDANNVIGYGACGGLSALPLKNPDGSWVYYTLYTPAAAATGRHISLGSGDIYTKDNYFDLQTTSRIILKFTRTFNFTGDFTYRRYERRTVFRGQPLYYREYPEQEMQSYTTGAGSNYMHEKHPLTQYYTVNAYFSYDETYGKGHHLAVTAGMNYEYRYLRNFSINVYDLTSTELTDVNLVGVDDEGNTDIVVNGGQNEYKLMGFFGRINYDYKERYLVEVSGRYDGTSRFAKGHRWGFFPSASAGWRISEEPFFESARKVVDNLKLRVSFGSLGNQNVSSYYTYLRLIENGNNLNYSFNEGNSHYLRYSDVGDPVAGDLTWEVVQQYDVGIDYTMLSNRLNLTVDGYIRNTTGMLGEGMDLPSVYGAGVPEMNCADLTTRGYEITLSWKDHFMLGGRLFEYNVGGTLSDYTSRITKFYGNDTKLLSNYYVGYRIGQIWGYRTDGIFQNWDEVNEYNSKVDASYITYYGGGMQPGDLRYVDVDGDGVIGRGSNTLDDHGDKVYLGNSQPSFNYGFNFGIKYFGFDISVFFQGTGNHYYYPHTYAGNFWGPFYYSTNYTFIPKGFINKCWSEDNPDAYYPRPVANITSSGSLSHVNDRYLQNIRYLRLKNVTAGYTIPEKVTRKITIEKVRVYFTGENLYFWSPIKKHTGNYQDPEALRINNSDSGYYNIGYYPWANSFIFGIDITF